MSDDRAPTRSRIDPDLVRLRFPAEIQGGALVFAEYGESYYPAITWEQKDAKNTLYGLAFLTPIEKETYGYPISISVESENWVLVVKSDWHLGTSLKRSTISGNLPDKHVESGLVFGTDGTYLRLPFISRRAMRPLWQLIHVTTGASPTQFADNRLIHVSGWDLFLSDQEKPYVTWPPRSDVAAAR